MKKFLGAQYPLVKTPRGVLGPINGVDAIKADLLQLLLTNPGERIMLPLYGVPLRKLHFEQNDVFLEAEARRMIALAIQTWEPRIEISNIVVSSSIDEKDLNRNDNKEDLDSILSIKILFFDPEQINEVQELVLEVPTSGV